MKKMPFLTAAAIAFGLSTSTVVSAAASNATHGCQYEGSRLEQHVTVNGHQRHKPAKHLVKTHKKQLKKREFTKSQLETLVSARLIMLGNDNLRPGRIEEDKDGHYRVDIVTQNGSLAFRRVLGKNSLPVGLDGKPKAFGMGLQMLAPSQGQRSEISAEQARTLVEARILVIDNPYLKVSTVKKYEDKGYIVQIATRDGEPVTERFISKKGYNSALKRCTGIKTETEALKL